MAIIQLSNTGYTRIPEGWHTFEVIESEYKEDFGKLTITLKTENGLNHKETFTLINAMGETNEKAVNAFTMFAKNCMNDFSLTQVDEQKLVGRKLRGRIEYVEGTKINPKTGKKYVNISMVEKKPVVQDMAKILEPEDLDFNDVASSISAGLDF